MLAAARAQVDGGRGGLTAPTSKPGKGGGKGRIAVLLDQQTDGEDHLTATAIQFQLAVWPVAEAVRYPECRRVHRRTVGRERIKNSRSARSD